MRVNENADRPRPLQKSEFIDLEGFTGGVPEVTESATPHPRLKMHRQFQSRILPDARDLVVYVPPGYNDDTERRYPVLYLQDGQNLFDPRTSFIPGRTWEVREHADAAIRAGEVEPLIIVGVYNTGNRRLAEYTPVEDWKMGGGEATAYGKLLTRELMPFIERTYRTRRGPEDTALGGSSLGGLVTLFLGLEHSEVFGKLAVMSPSVWWNHKYILGYLNEIGPALRRRPKMWLDVGDHEGRKTLADADLLHRRLIANGWQPEQNLHYERVLGGTHDEAAWARRVRPMLRFLFPAKGEFRAE